MKITLIAISFTLITSWLCSQDLSFEEKKSLYSPKSYTWQVGDKYDPSIATIFSVLVPGLGQVYAGETARGIGFFTGSTIVPIVLFNIAITKNKASVEFNCSSYPCESSGGTAGRPFAVFGIASMLGFYIWNIVDASQVAKVKNLYIRGESSKKVTFHTSPNLLYQEGKLNPVLNLSLNF